MKTDRKRRSHWACWVPQRHLQYPRLGRAAGEITPVRAPILRRVLCGETGRPYYTTRAGPSVARSGRLQAARGGEHAGAGDSRELGKSLPSAKTSTLSWLSDPLTVHERPTSILLYSGDERALHTRRRRLGLAFLCGACKARLRRQRERLAALHTTSLPFPARCRVTAPLLTVHKAPDACPTHRIPIS